MITENLWTFEVHFTYNKPDQDTEGYGYYHNSEVDYQGYQPVQRRLIKESSIRRYEKHTIVLSEVSKNFLRSFVGLRRVNSGSTAVWVNSTVAIKLYLCPALLEKVHALQKILAQHGLAPQVIGSFSGDQPYENFLIMEYAGQVVNEDKLADLPAIAEQLYSEATNLGFEIDDQAPDNIVCDTKGVYRLIDFDGWEHPDVQKLNCGCHKD